MMKILFITSLYANILITIVSFNSHAQNKDIEDSNIAFAIEAKLLADKVTSRHLINVRVKDGVVTLSGHVDNPLDCERAIKMVEAMSNIQSVINNISVTHIVRSDNQIMFGRKKNSGLTHARDFQKINMNLKKRIRPLSYGNFIAGASPVDPIALEIKEDEQGNKSDEEIKRAVRDAIFHNPEVVSINIQVEVKEGVVILTGAVDNPEAKNAAEEEAKNTAGVFMVKNYLRIRPGMLPGYSTTAERVRDVLSGNSLTRHLDIDTEVQNGKVYLYGTVNTLFEKQHAGEIASQVTGVVSVINKLNVNSRWLPKTDKEIKEKVETELIFSVFVHSPEISVNVKKGVAYLTGSVHTRQEALAAIENAYDGGARTVRNLLEIRGEADEGLKQLRTKDPFYLEIDYPGYFEDFYFKPYYYYLYP
ncbi:MAG: Osmotically inducible protein Y precursor [Candidatus Jettenia ecosi]|uniref:Osmotically inducible protein Y n=1 Tax=Candidatus Jettenia ecosi TaxID=2494326 RepID=A0A533Q874_9BACT|nr:MAG: Osmotically inducible protein Y precursor [Candidatus Jettenia ecosi]